MSHGYKRNPLAPPPLLRPLEEAALRTLRELTDRAALDSVKRYAGIELHELAEAMGREKRFGHQRLWGIMRGLIERGLAQRLHGFDGQADLLITEEGRCLLSQI
jgi:hypothetical protein